MPFHVSVRGDRRRPEIAIHRAPTLWRADIRTQLGIRVTSPARTLLDCAPGLPDRRLARMVNDGRLDGRLRMSELADVVKRFPYHPGCAHLKPFLSTRDAPTRSEFEDAFLAFCRDFGLPEPKVNSRVCGYEVDVLFAAERVIVELDGWDFHQDRRAFERDRNRDADTLASGLATVRITWPRMSQAPQAEAARLRTILEQWPKRS